MYLEISGRRSGKTTRLVDDMVEYIDMTDSVVVLRAPSTNTKEWYMDQIPKGYHEHIRYTNPISNKVTHLEICDVRIYFDEFTQLENNNYNIIKDNAYYVTTPAGRKISFLHALLGKNKGCYNHYNIMDKYTNEELEYYIETIGRVDFNREILGRWY